LKTLNCDKLRKISLLLLFSLSIMIFSCREDYEETQLKEDIEIIDTYVKSYKIQGSYIQEGIYKTVLNTGTGPVRPVSRNGIYINYRLMLPNKTVINQESKILTQQGLEQFFEGFDIAASNMIVGEKSQFLIASQYAYGSRSFSVDGKNVPSNAVVLLEIELLEIVEEGEIINFYIEKKSKTVEKTSSGLYYNIIYSSETGIKPELDDIVTIEYTNYYINDTIVSEDQTTTFGIEAQEDWDETPVIDGIEEGVLKMKEGDIAEFIIPASLAYYNYDDNTISKYAILKYRIKLTQVR
jgi:FKBP-type peptidyl-prolyl cis-trans isomerase